MTTPTFERTAFLLATAATMAAGMRDDQQAHQLAEMALILTLQAQVLRHVPELDPADATLLLLSLTAAAAGGWHMATTTHQPDPHGNNAGLMRGVAAFSAAQLCTLALLRRQGAGLHAGGWPARLGAAGLGLAVIAARNPRNLPALGGYGSLLSGMALLAADPRLNSARLHRGGWMFVASDLLILVRRYLLTDVRARAAAEGVMLALYAGAQQELTGGLLELMRRSPSP